MRVINDPIPTICIWIFLLLKGICTSNECSILAGDILKDMKPEIDPCSDFFSYTCTWKDMEKEKFA